MRNAARLLAFAALAASGSLGSALSTSGRLPSSFNAGMTTATLAKRPSAGAAGIRLVYRFGGGVSLGAGLRDLIQGLGRRAT